MSDRADLRMTVADSSPSYPVRPKPKSGAPNVVTILFDDLGFSQFGCFGADIDTPNIDRLAANGLRYNRFHVTAICSPTRAALLTGRNHHAVGMGFLCDMPLAFPGYNGIVPPSAAPLPKLLKAAGYSTMAVGKWHLAPAGERSPAGPFDRWPLGFGFERYYGFLRGDANHWSPLLCRDNQYVDPPAAGYPDGYHLTEDLASTAIRYVQEQQQSAPGKPFFLYFALGATHAPHHAPKEWIDRNAGRYERGWEAFREQAFARQQTSGVVPKSATLTPRPSWVPAWNDLSDDARRVFSRMHEVYAAFLSHTDHQIGRLIEFLERIGQLDNTLILLTSDNGTSAEGGRLGTANEHRFTHRMEESVEGLLAQLDDWGSDKAYHHYAWGWAWAGNTPFRLWKRYTWLGGSRTPMVVHWPAGIPASENGSVRSQFCHAIDIMPTVLDATGVEQAETFQGVTQQRMDGASILPTFADRSTTSPRKVQYFEMLGSRSIYADEWKATTDHVSAGVVDEERLLEGSRNFDNDRWSLFNLADDYSEAHDIADQHPERLARMKEQWLIEAGRNNVLPMDDTLIGRAGVMVPPLYPPQDSVVFRPGVPVVDEAIPRLNFGGRMTARVDIPTGGAEGILCALGDRTNGYAMYLKDGRLCFSVNIGGEVTTARSDTTVPEGTHDLGAQIVPSLDATALVVLVDDALAGAAESQHALPFAWQHGGALMFLGEDRGLPVNDDYTCPFTFTGHLHQLRVDSKAPASPRLSATQIREALRFE